MNIEVSLSPALYPFRTLTQHHTTVAIDLLRATTAVCAAFQAGCNSVIPLSSLDELPHYRSLGYQIAAERGGSKVGDAEYGNSPTEYLRNDMTGKNLAYSTTNGTISILCAANAELTLVGSFANLSTLCEKLYLDKSDVVLLCSGWKNDFCIEDTLVAGAIIEKMMQITSQVTLLNDASQMAMAMWQVAKEAPFDYCQRCTHVHRLYGLGAKADVEFAFRQDTCPVIPVFNNGILTLLNR